MSLEDVIDLSISANTVTPTRAGFGTPLLMACHAVTPNLVDTYSSLADMVSAGFPVTHPAYKMAQIAFSQNPRPAKVVIGKRTTKHTKTVRLFPLNTTQGFHYLFTAVGVDGTKTAIDYAVPGAATVASICAALAALLGAVNGVTVTSTATYVQFAATVVGTLFDITGLPTIANMKVLDTTADPGIVADYNAIKAIDFTTWYGVAIDSNSKAEVTALAAAIEADRRIFLADAIDTEVTDNAVTTDVVSVLKAAAYARTAAIYNSRSILSYTALGWMAAMLPKDPGSNTWAFKSIAGVTVDNIPDGPANNTDAKNGNFYTVLAGLNMARNGKMASGTFIDVTIFLDWLHARMQERIIFLMYSADKIPYTDSGADIVRGALLAQLDAGVKIGGLSPTPAPSVVIPKVADQDPIDRANRFMPNIKFSANLAGAIHKLKIGGTISV